MGQLLSTSRCTSHNQKVEVDFPDSSSEVTHYHRDEHLPSPISSGDNLPILKKAKGHYWYPVNGPKILDACGGAGVACLGHGRKDIVKAATKQMKAFQYASYAHFKVDPVLELSQFLIDSTGGEMQKVYLMCSGSEATEAAIKLAIEYYQWINQPQRVNFITRHDSYHGTTLGSLSVSGHHTRRLPFHSILSSQNFHHILPFNPYRQQSASESLSEFITRKLVELETRFLSLGPETVAAVILEPVVGAAMGCVPSPPSYLSGVRSLCDKYGALLILDEVMCGMGRTGRLHAWQHQSEQDSSGNIAVPDLQTIAKSFAGGYMPASALLVSLKITSVMNAQQRVFTHGHTYQNHPVVASVALAVQRTVQKQNLVANALKMGELLGKRLKYELGNHQNVGDIRGRGLFWGIEFVKNKATKEPFDAAEGMAQKVWKVAMEEFRVLLYSGQGCAGRGRGDHVMIMPAYDIGEKEVGEIVRRLKGAVVRVFGEREA
ncbi:putative aminotransferase YodT [Cladorrhinum sp. PSN259]|nr:putative aminotransferase YodT [Cladorrhinum sp. PSN259]